MYSSQVGEELQTLLDIQELGQIGELRTIAQVLARFRVILVVIETVYEYLPVG
jgi:hypothetical protein